MATTSAAGLAGCSGGGGDSSSSGDSGGDLGERVPALTVASMTSVAGASSIEQANKHVAKQLTDVIGVPASVQGKELTTLWNEAYSDSRTFNYHVDLTPPFPRFLDPDPMIYPYNINAAGKGGPNVINYANCDYSKKVEAQRTAANPDERHNIVNEAVSIASDDVAPTTLVTNTASGVYRTDQLDAKNIGKAGTVGRNPQFLWSTTTTNGASGIRSNATPSNINNKVYFVNQPASPWTGTVYTPLVFRDKNYELAAGAANDWTVENEYKKFTFNLRDGMTFHNGDDLTSEDVKWTLEFLNQNAGDTFPPVAKYPYKSIETPDDTTVVVTMESSQPSWLNAFVPIWSGVLPKQVWQDAGAEENPKDPDFDQIVGSGPFEVVQFQPRQLLALEPFEDHYNPAETSLTFRGYSDRQAAKRAFQAGDLNLIINSTEDTNSQLADELGDKVKIVNASSFVSYELRAQHSFAPTMFKEFRLAVSQSLNRLRINSYLSAGKGEPELYSSFLGKTHPWRPPEDDLTKIADSPQGNTDKAKQILKDAGWGWDGDGRLHYPPDKDLTPPWPEQSSPCENPDGFPCLPDLCQ
ncbi:MAG: ABC transporter substrate-binding protein [Haloarculaceae archaeon]